MGLVFIRLDNYQLVYYQGIVQPVDILVFARIYWCFVLSEQEVSANETNL